MLVLQNSAVDERPVARREKSNPSTMEPKSIKEYPKATKIEIPLTEETAKWFFHALPKPYFGRPNINTMWIDATSLNIQRMPLKALSYLDVMATEEDVPGFMEPQIVEIILYERDWKGTRRAVASFRGEINGSDRRLVITLLVPVPTLRERAIRYLDDFRFFIHAHRTFEPEDVNATALMKSVNEMDQMKKVMIRKGLPEEMAQDQAARALLPAEIQRLMRPDSLGGNAEDRKKATQMMADARIAKLRGGRKTRRRRKL